MTARKPASVPVDVVSVLQAARPLLAFFPSCRLHPTIAPLPESCGDCRRWESARRVLADVDALLGGGRDA